MYRNNHTRRSYPAAKKRRIAKWPFAAALCAGLVILAGVYFWSANHHETSTPSSASGTNNSNSQSSTAQQPAAGFDKHKYSNDDPTSPWVVVDKQRPLQPKTYAPADLKVPDIAANGNEQLNATTADALKSMVASAQTQGVNLGLASGYRSYQTQVSVYASEVKSVGQAQADRESARPGYSEHQSGWAADLSAVNGKCRLQQCFADTPEGTWLAANAYKHGFVIRYPQGKETITGYEYEPWHVRYVGVELATEMHKQGVSTLEEFFGLPAAPSY
jgi:D-alanyl-D-alanine carboxypeptidase